jgi:hypothetical protein
MSAREGVYAFLAAVGVVLPWLFNLQWMQEAASPSPIAFFGQGFVNPAASSLTVDLFIACTAFFVFVLVEGRRLQMRWAWLLLPYALVVAFASALPLFLLLRERRLRASADPGSA